MLAKPVSKWVSLNTKWYQNWGMFGTETNFESFLCENTCIVPIGSIPLGARLEMNHFQKSSEFNLNMKLQKSMKLNLTMILR